MSELKDKTGGKGGPAAAGAPATRENAPKRQRPGKISASGKLYIDYKETETLRRLTAANGKISGRKRTGADALEQRMIASAIKRARYMGLVAYQNTTT